jgi:hypothetical protein
MWQKRYKLFDSAALVTPSTTVQDAAAAAAALAASLSLPDDALPTGHAIANADIDVNSDIADGTGDVYEVDDEAFDDQGGASPVHVKRSSTVVYVAAGCGLGAFVVLAAVVVGCVCRLMSPVGKSNGGRVHRRKTDIVGYGIP